MREPRHRHSPPRRREERGIRSVAGKGNDSRAVHELQQFANFVRLPPDRLPAAKSAMEAMILASRAEPGCLVYGYAEDVGAGIDPCERDLGEPGGSGRSLRVSPSRRFPFARD